MPVSKRKIKPLIDQGLVSGFDDPRLPTLRGLQRRGIIPEAIRDFVFSQGISKMESTVTFSSIEAVNRKLLDPIVKRFFFVPNPIQLVVDHAPKQTVTLPLHPTDNLGTRKITTASTFYLPGDDLSDLQPGQTFRLKELFNVTLSSKGKTLHGEYAGTQLIPDTLKLQWVTDDHLPFTVHIPGLLVNKDESFNQKSMHTITGLAETGVQHLHHGDIIQFERFGFVRLEKTKDSLQGIFTHK